MGIEFFFFCYLVEKFGSYVLLEGFYFFVFFLYGFRRKVVFYGVNIYFGFRYYIVRDYVLVNSGGFWGKNSFFKFRNFGDFNFCGKMSCLCVVFVDGVDGW